MRSGSQREQGAGAIGVRGGLRRLAAFAALLAIVLQTFVIQTHVHGAGLGVRIDHSTLTLGGVGAGQVVVTAEKADDDCALCQALATGGRALLTEKAALAAHFGRVVQGADFAIARVSVRPGHSWQSRAPPIAL